MFTEVGQRDDYEICRHFCDLLACDSYAEALFVLKLMEEGAHPCLVAPALLSRLPHPLIDPRTRKEISHRPQLCMVTRNAVHFFQAALSTPKTITVDVLRWRNRWDVIEINGEGHDASEDAQRRSRLGLPVTYLTPRQVLEFKVA